MIYHGTLTLNKLIKTQSRAKNALILCIGLVDPIALSVSEPHPLPNSPLSISYTSRMFETHTPTKKIITFGTTFPTLGITMRQGPEDKKCIKIYLPNFNIEGKFDKLKILELAQNFPRCKIIFRRLILCAKSQPRSNSRK
jgi:hypothetical protein